MKMKKCPPTYDNSLAVSLSCIGIRPRIKFDDQSLKQDKVNIYIVYEMNVKAQRQSADFMLGDSLFEAVMLTNICNLDKHNAFWIKYWI